MVKPAAKSRLLVVEDERNIGTTLTERLQSEGYEVAWATTAEEARFEIDKRRFDLAILDVGLPDDSGFNVAIHLRRSQPGAAMMFLSAYGNPEHRIKGLELGAEDYIVKPFHMKELLLRIENGLRRARYLQDGADTVTVGRATIRFSRFEAEVDGQVHGLTQRETALLKLLVNRKGAVVSRDEILDQVWSEDEYPTSRTVDNFIMRLRRIVEKDPEHPEVIRSVRGVGYQLV